MNNTRSNHKASKNADAMKQQTSWNIFVCCERRTPSTLSPIEITRKKHEQVGKAGMGIFSRKFGRKCNSKKRSSSEPNEDIIRFSPRTTQLECVDCRQSFDSDLALYQHCRLEHSDNFVDARCCDAQLYTLAAFAAHAEARHFEQHLCIRCHEFFESVEALERHVKKHGAHSEACALFCILCGAYRRSESDMASHMESTHELDEKRGSRFVCRVPIANQDDSAYKKQQGDEEDDNEKDTISLNEDEEPSLLPCIPVAHISDRLLSSLWNC